MKVLACKDVGVDCEYAAFGETVDEVLRKVSEHGEKYHGIEGVDSGYLKAWRGKIHESTIDCCATYGSE